MINSLLLSFWYVIILSNAMYGKFIQRNAGKNNKNKQDNILIKSIFFKWNMNPCVSIETDLHKYVHIKHGTNDKTWFFSYHYK